jgi:hypothetical protein
VQDRHDAVAESASGSDEQGGDERPSWACCLCPPLRNGGWVQADARHVTCSGCYDRIRDLLNEVADRYLHLDARPGAFGDYGSRGAPGFRSRSPASDHVIALRDPRSSLDAHIWVGGDGRVHGEQERPPPSVHGVLSTAAWSIAEHRGIAGPEDRDDVHALLRWVDRHTDYITRHAELALEVDESLRNLVGALRPVTGDGRRQIGKCPNVVVQEEPPTHEQLASNQPGDCTPIRCDAPLYAPTKGDVIHCVACGKEWPMHEWLALGDALNEAGVGRGDLAS